MAAERQIIRGQGWGRPLRGLLALSSDGTVTWFEQHCDELKTDAYSRVGLILLQGELCFAKLYLAKSPWQQLGFRLGYGRGIRSYDIARELAHAGLPVPTARTCLLVPEGMVLLTRGIAAARDLRALWQAQPERAGELLPAAGRLLAQLHSAGFAHGDCKWSNLLWNGQHFFLVDLEAVRRVGDSLFTRSRARQLRDLARFTVDAEELAVGQSLYDDFLASYVAARGCSADEVIEGMKPMVESIRIRHRAKYGTNSQELI